jgi:TRAP-type uncharacterized transport system fused permease subunit
VDRDRAGGDQWQYWVIALAAGLEGYFLKNASWLERGLFLAAAFLLIDPQLVTDVLGLACLGAALLSQKLRRGVPVIEEARSLP